MLVHSFELSFLRSTRFSLFVYILCSPFCNLVYKIFFSMMLARRDSIHNRVIPFLSCIVSVIVIVTVYCTCCVVFVVVVVASSFFVGYFLVNDRAPLVKNFQNYGFCCCFCAFVELSTIEIVEIYSHIHWIRGQFEISVRYNHHFVCTLTRFLSISISLKYTHIHSIAYTRSNHFTIKLYKELTIY